MDKDKQLREAYYTSAGAQQNVEEEKPIKETIKEDNATGVYPVKDEIKENNRVQQSYQDKANELKNLYNTYTSDNYQAALGALNGANGIDGSGDTLQSVYDQIVNRKPFSYNIDEDMMYRQYVDQYTNLGRLAMNDTMGQAAMLTGGYGNSYGQAVGQQQYDAYLQQLNGIIPDLYDRAYQRYMDEGTALQNKYAFMQANPQYAGGSTGGSSGGSLPTTVQNPGLTRDEIIEFQKANGLTPDGEWGPYTQKMWNKVYPGMTVVPKSDTTGNTTGDTTGKGGETIPKWDNIIAQRNANIIDKYFTPTTTTGATTGATTNPLAQGKGPVRMLTPDEEAYLKSIGIHFGGQ